MLGAMVRNIFGTANDRYIKRLQRLVDAINAREERLEKLSDEELKGQTDLFRKRLDDGELLDDLLPDAFATVREAAKRTLGQRHFDVQLIGGVVLHRGMIAEMKTGEGKTLVATLAVYLNALQGKGVHVVTVNDYLASRDAEWMGQIYNFLGLTVGGIVHGMDDTERRQAYACDVTYGTNNEFGFDYLRDNMKFRLEDMVQRPFNFAIVDEVDSILIDEARTPLIISGKAEESSEKYRVINKIIPRLSEEHYEKDEKQRQVTLTEIGLTRVEELLRLDGIIEQDSTMFDVANVSIVHHIDQALKAHKLFQRDVDYIVKDDKIVIIDEFTGRMMEGRRYSEGLHQAIEAKEKVSIQSENQTLASITFQNYFRLYPKLAGMTGTAMTEAAEFVDIYSLDAIEIPTNLPLARIDNDDEVYRTAREKYDAIIDTILACHEKGQPILVGTTSIEKSEHLAKLLAKRDKKIDFEVLNARHHAREAFIVAQAGVPGGITIATNMAGRGTDIQLGGNLDMRIEAETNGTETPEQLQAITERIKSEIAEGKKKALDAGGLYVLGTERHESRRIDNQLRGRSGRQGDPGESKFFLSLDDDLMRIFGSERMDAMLVRLGLQDGEAIIHPWINKALAKAQEKVEGRNFDIRKNLLKYDDVMNDQRKVVYQQRRQLMEAEDVSQTIEDMRYEAIDDIIDKHIPPKALPDEWDVNALQQEITRLTAQDLPVIEWAQEEGVSEDILRDRISDALDKHMKDKEDRFGEELMRMVEKSLLLQLLDQSWKEHLLVLDQMRHTILLRAYGQKDPLNEYKQESFTLFKDMLDQLRERVTAMLSRVEIRTEDADTDFLENQAPTQMREVHESPVSALSGSPAPQQRPEEAEKQQPFRHAEFDENNPATWGRVPRNAPCPCGSGKKFKHCHGRVT